MGNLTAHPTSEHTAVQARGRRRPAEPDARVVVPVRYAAWLAGDMGRALEHSLESALSCCNGVRISRLPRAFLVEAREAPGPFLEAVHRATLELEAGVAATYPVFHHEMGPVWTGTLQAVFT